MIPPCVILLFFAAWPAHNMCGRDFSPFVVLNVRLSLCIDYNSRLRAHLRGFVWRRQSAMLPPFGSFQRFGGRGTSSLRSSHRPPRPKLLYVMCTSLCCVWCTSECYSACGVCVCVCVCVCTWRASCSFSTHNTCTVVTATVYSTRTTPSSISAITHPRVRPCGRVGRFGTSGRSLDEVVL